MSQQPPLLRDQCKIDANHLKLLSIFHFVKAGMDFLGIIIITAHYEMSQLFFKLWEEQKHVAPPIEFAISKWIYLIFAVLCIVFGVLNLISGLFIRARIHRTFSLVIAGVNCFFTPYGTLLGVFSIIVLIRDSVQELYRASSFTNFSSGDTQ